MILYNALLPFYNNFGSPKLTNAEISKKLSPKLPLTNKYINNRIHDLNTELRIFLATQQVRNNPKLKALSLRKALLQLGQFDDFQQESKKQIKALTEIPQYNWEHFLSLWSLHYDVFAHPQTHKFTEKKDEATDMISYLDEAYIILKLRFGFHKMWRQRFFNEGTVNDIPLLFPILKYAENYSNPVIQLYLYLFKYFEADDKKFVFEAAFKAYQNHLSVLPCEEKLIVLTALINMANDITLNNTPNFFERLFSLYQIGLEQKLFIRFENISEQTFKNIVVTGASLKKFEWVEKFAKEYRQYLPKNASSTIALSEAYVNFYKGDFQLVLNYLQNYPKPRLSDKLNFKSLNVRCLYEIQLNDNTYQETLLNFLEAFNKFISKNKQLSENRKKPYKNFIYLVKQLSLKWHSPKSDNTKEELQRLAMKRRNFIAKTWILEKINQF